MALRARCTTASGQASADYVALLAVVALALGAAVTAAHGPVALAAAVTGAVRHGICLVAGGVCTPEEARAAGLGPCLVHARGDRERLAVKAVLVRLERGDALLVEQRSDGTAAVSFLDGGRGGLVTGVGLRLPWDAKARIEGGAGVQFTAGRTWEFRTVAAAERFAHRWAGQESVKGEARGLARRLCPFCHHRPSPPPPQATYYEGGAYGDFSADVGLKLPHLGQSPSLHLDGRLGEVAGRRVSGHRVTWYLRLDYNAAGRLGAIVGAVSSAQRDAAALEVSLDHGRPVALVVHGAAAMRGQLDLLGATTSLGELARRLRGGTGAGRAGEGSGLGVEASVTLDLTDERNRRAALDVLHLFRAAPREWSARLHALGARLDADGSVDVGVYRTSASTRDAGLDAALGIELGGSYSHETETRALLRAWSLRHGGALSEREDCVAG